MTAMISVVSGDAVVGSQRFSVAKSGKVARISAVKGARYLLADGDGSSMEGVTVKRAGQNLVLEQQSDAEHATLIIEDFFGSEGQLVGLTANGEYLSYLAVSENGAANAEEMTEGASALLSLATVQTSAQPVGFQFNEGGSTALTGALAGLAAVAGGLAFNNRDGGGKAAPSAAIASNLVLEDQSVDALVSGSASAETVAGMDFPAVNASVEPQPETTAESDAPVADVEVIAEVAAPVAGDVAESQPMERAEADDVVAEDAEVGEETKGRNKPVANAVDGAAKMSAVGAAFSIDDVPVIEAMIDRKGVIQGVIENGGYTDDGRPQIVGKAEPGVLVNVYRGVDLLSRTVADENGNWVFVPQYPLADGRHSITIILEHPNGDSSPESEPYVIIVDKVIPDVPVVIGILDDEGRITGAITEQTITDDNRPTINGTAEAGATLIVYDKGKEIGRTTVGSDGKWSFTPDVPLADGVHILSYTAVDRAGNVSERSGATEFVVDTRPEKINIYFAEDDVGSVTGEVFSGGVTDDSTPTLFGSATAGGIVKIYEGTALLGEVTAGVDGTWQFTPSIALSEGAHTLHATVTLVAKGESERSKPFNLEVDLTAPSVPTIEQVLDDVGSIQGLLENGGLTDDNKPSFTGKADAGSTVSIYDAGNLLGSAVADVDGTWTFTPPAALPDGEHSFTVVASDQVGNTSAASDAFGITINSVLPSQPTIDSVYDDAGIKTGNLAMGEETDDYRPDISGSADAGSTVVIKDHGVEIARVQTNAQGKWVFTPAENLAEGAHKLTAESVGTAGNTSVPSDRFDFSVAQNGDDNPRELEAAGSARFNTMVLLDLTSSVQAHIPSMKQTLKQLASEYLSEAGGAPITLTLARMSSDPPVKYTFSSTADAGYMKYMAAVNSLVVSGNGTYEMMIQKAIGSIKADYAANQGPNQIFILGDAGNDLTMATAEKWMAMLLDPTGGAPLEVPITSTPISYVAFPHYYENSFHWLATGGKAIDVPPPEAMQGIILGSAIADSVTGNTLVNDAKLTLDGNEHLTKISYDGGTFRIGGNGALVMSNVGADVKASYNESTGLLTIETGFGWLRIYMHGSAGHKAGDYMYATKLAQLYQGEGLIHQNFSYQAVDGKSVTQTASIHITIRASEVGADSLAKGVAVSSAIDVVEPADGAAFADSQLAGKAGFSIDDVPVIEAMIDRKGVIQGVIENGGYTDDGRPQIVGKAEPGVLVNVYRGVDLLSRTVADENGNWVFVPQYPLADGRHSITIILEHPNGDSSPESEPYVIIVDKVIPDVPVVIGILDDEGRITGAITEQTITDDNRPTINGTAEAGATLIVYDKGKEIGRTTVGSDGKWSFTPDVPLADGVHILSYTAVDRAGNVSERSGATEFVVDTRPEKINIYFAEDDVGSVTGEVFSGGVTDDSTPTLFGSATAGGIVKIYEGTALLGEVTAGVDGTWQFTPSIALSEGAHTLHATVTLVAKGESDRSKPFNLEVDLTAPNVPTIEQALDDVGAVQGLIGNGQKTDDATPTLTGKAEKGSTVSVYDNDILLGETVADASGNWTFTPKAPLLDGTYSFTVKAQDKAGNVSHSSSSFVVIIDTNHVEAPVIVNVQDDVGTKQYMLKEGDTTDDARPTFHGAAQPGSIVTIYDGVDQLGQVVADVDGNWSFTPKANLVDGHHGITATATNSVGTVSDATSVWNFIVDTVAPDQATNLKVTDNVGSEQGVLINGATTDDNKPTFSGKAEAGSTVNVYDGSALLGSAVADGNGGWSFTPSKPLADGKHKFTTEVIDQAGNSSGKGNAITLHVDISITVYRPDAVDLNEGSGPTQSYMIETGDAPTQLYRLYVDGQIIEEVWLDGHMKWNTATSWTGAEDEVFQLVVVKDGFEIEVARHTGTQLMAYGALWLDTQLATLHPATEGVAVISSVGKAAGSNGDFVTSDGSAGREVSGTVTGNLANGLTVQVSVDGGSTWHDAVTHGKNWMFIDTSVHSSSWTVQVRVDGGSRESTVSSKQVALVGSPGAPTITSISEAAGIYTAKLAQDGSEMTVALTGTGAKVGDTVHIQWGTSTYDQVLTAVNIASGSVTLNVPAAVTHATSSYKYDFVVTAQIIGQDGGPGAVSNPFDVVGTYARALASDTLQLAPVANVYSGNGLTVTTTGTMAKTAATTNSVAGLTVSDSMQANATFTLSKPADYISLQLSGADNELGAYIHVYDVNGKLMHEQVVFGDATAKHLATFAWTKTGLVDIGSFTVTAMSSSVTLASFNQYVVTHTADTRNPNLIDILTETFYGSATDDVVTLSQSAATYFAQSTAAVHGGTGVDTLKLAGVGHVLNLTTAGSKISSMEVVDLTTGANSLILNLSDVLRNGGSDLFYTGDKSRVQMMVKGNANDVVSLSDLVSDHVDHGDWVKKGVVQIDGINYNSYQHSSLDVEVLATSLVTVNLKNSTLVGATAASASDVGVAPATELLSPVEEELFSMDRSMSNRAGSMEQGESFYHAQSLNTDAFELHSLRLEAY